jgi:hypothetical protein
MDVLDERCCGLDIHTRTVVACLVVPGCDGQPVSEVRHFGTMTDELLGRYGTAARPAKAIPGCVPP